MSRSVFVFLACTFIMYGKLVFSDSSTIRLMGGKYSHEGRVEVFYKGKWGTVCGVFFRQSAADVVCRQLGHGEAVSYQEGTQFGRGSGPLWIDFLSCTGYEKSLFDCKDLDLDDPFFCRDHSQDASVTCKTIPPLQNILYQKRVFTVLKILHDGEWGYICNDGWNKKSADVACRMLGHKRSFVLKSVTIPHNHRRWLKNVKCSGKERNIEECSHDGWANFKCLKVVSAWCASGTYEGNACGGRVCEDSLQGCCKGVDYEYCCKKSPTTTSVMSTKLTSTTPVTSPKRPSTTASVPSTKRTLISSVTSPQSTRATTNQPTSKNQPCADQSGRDFEFDPRRQFLLSLLPILQKIPPEKAGEAWAKLQATLLEFL